MYNLLKFTIITILFEFSNQAPIPTTSGIVIGKKVKILNKYVVEYLGIPYAIPPVGNQRFKYPKPLFNDNRLINATNKSPSCIQEAINPATIIKDRMSEDCLYLNVWVPVCSSEEHPLTTMVWIHGGGFFSGSANVELSDGGIIASIGCVIVVSFNYRVGVFGFLNLNTDEAPGNMGMMDQVMALQWVNKNIAAFGGDQHKITLFGHSAGGVSIANHLVSLLTKNLFKRVIIQSSFKYSNNNIFTAENTFYNINISEIIASKLGCKFTNNNDIVTCMRSLDPHSIAFSLKSYVESIPTIKGLLPQLKLPYLPGDDEVNIHCADVIIGNTKDDGSFLLRIYRPEFVNQENPTLTKPEAKRIIRLFYKDYNINQEDLNNIFDKYLETIPNKDFAIIINQTYQAMNDGAYICPSYFLAEQLSEFTRQRCNDKNVRYYTFDHKRITCGLQEWLGVTHKEEVPFVFGMPFRKPECYTSEETTLSRNIINMWTSYAKTGKPTYPDMDEEWLPFNEDKNSVNIQLTKILGQEDAVMNKCNFWRKIYKNDKYFEQRMDLGQRSQTRIPQSTCSPRRVDIQEKSQSFFTKSLKITEL